MFAICAAVFSACPSSETLKPLYFSPLKSFLRVVLLASLSRAPVPMIA